MKLSEVSEGRLNNFDCIRFLAAFMVIYSHSFALLGVKGEPIRTYCSGLVSFGSLAVATFFIISGFLITRSYLMSSSLFSYLKKRILRIIPALFIVVLLTVFVLGPLLTDLSLEEYLSHSRVWKYLKNILLIKSYYDLPGVFEQNPYPVAVNSSLWTLPLEFFMYLLVPVFAFLGAFRMRYRLLLVLIALFILRQFVYVGDLESAKFLHVIGKHFADLGFYFFAGALLYIYREQITLHWGYCLLSCVVMLIAAFYPALSVLKLFALPYLIIYCAYAFNGCFHSFAKYGDFSYGLYIYAFPVQQTLSMFYAGEISFLVYFLLASVITLLFAILSWHLIERPALLLKGKKFFNH